MESSLARKNGSFSNLVCLSSIYFINASVFPILEFYEFQRFSVKDDVPTLIIF